MAQEGSIILVLAAVAVMAVSRHHQFEASLVPWAAVLAAGGVLYAWSSGWIGLRLAGPRSDVTVRTFKRRVYRNMAAMAAMGIAIGIIAATFRAAWIDILAGIVTIVMWVIGVSVGLHVIRKGHRGGA